MPLIDDDTEFMPGIQSGTCNHMRVGEGSTGTTLLQFVEYGRITGDHVDTAKVVGEVNFHNQDLPGLITLLQERVE